LTYLVDTSVVTRLRRPVVRARLAELDAAGVARASMTDLEIGYSARSAEEWGQLAGALRVFPLVPIQPQHFVRAGQIQRLLAQAGLRGRKVPDLLIAAAAESTSRVVLHYDGVYDHIASVTGQRSEWIVPQGSLD
jgi:predicted nucleic acid-binding protein